MSPPYSRTVPTEGPNFFLAGAAKSGTTALYAALREHPDVYLPARKEPHLYGYLALPSIAAYPDEATARRRYRKHYAGVAGEAAVGDASTSSLAVPGAAALIARDRPTARIVVVLRHPVDRAYSHFCHFVAAGGERTTDFAEAVRDEDKRQAEGFPFTYRYLGWSRYIDQLGPFLELFGRGRLLVHLYDDLRDDPEAVVRTTFRFLGVDHQVPIPPIGTHNDVRAPRLAFVSRAVAGGGPVRQAVRRRLAATPMRKPLFQLATTVVRPKPPLDPSLRAELTRRFEPDLCRLEDLLGRDLAGWR